MKPINSLNNFSVTLKRIFNASVLIGGAALLLILIILPLYFLAEVSALFINIPAALFYLAIAVWVAAGSLKSALRRGILTAMILTPLLVIPFSQLSTGSQRGFLIGLILWALTAVILITFAALTGRIHIALKKMRSRG